MKHYSEEIIVVGDMEFTPITDALHEEENGLLSNEVRSVDGEIYKAYYNQDHLKQDRWNKPLFVEA